MTYVETDRLRPRGWRDDDFAPFAAKNANQKVMEFFTATLGREHSDALAKRLRKALDENGWGLYAVEVKATADFIAYVGLAAVEFPARFTPAQEIGWRPSFPSWRHG